MLVAFLTNENLIHPQTALGSYEDWEKCPYLPKMSSLDQNVLTLLRKYFGPYCVASTRTHIQYTHILCET